MDETTEEYDVAEIQEWLAEEDPEAPPNLDEAAAIIQELRSDLGVLGEVAPDTLLVAAKKERLDRDVVALRVLTSVAEHLAQLEG